MYNMPSLALQGGRTYSSTSGLSLGARGGESGHDNNASDRGVASANEDGTSPVRAVLDIAVVAGLADILGLDHGRRLASGTIALRLLAGLTAFTTLLRESGGEGGLGAEEDADGRSELHFDFARCDIKINNEMTVRAKCRERSKRSKMSRLGRGGTERTLKG